MQERLIQVFEDGSRWFPELQRQFRDGWARIERVGELKGLRPQSGHPELVVLELRAEPAECLQFLGRRMENVWQVPVMILLSSDLSDLEWSLRELGVASIRRDDADGRDLARICRRLLTCGPFTVEHHGSFRTESDIDPGPGFR